MPNNQGENNYQQSRTRRPEARHKNQTNLLESPASLGLSRLDRCSSSAVSLPRKNDRYLTILHVLRCNLSRLQKRCNERNDSRISDVAKATNEPAPNLNDPTSIASHAIANPSILTLGPVSSANDKTPSPASRAVSRAQRTELIPESRKSDAQNLDSSGELISELDGVLAAGIMICGSRQGRSQDTPTLDNNEELLLNSVTSPESTATDRGRAHVLDVGGSPKECGNDSCQQAKKRHARATPEPDDRQTKRRKITPFAPSSPVQASFDRLPQPTASDPLAIHKVNNGLEEVRDMSALQPDDHTLRLPPISPGIERREQRELPTITQLVKLPTNPNDPTSIPLHAPDDSGPFGYSLVSCASETNTSSASRQVVEAERTDLIPDE